MTNPYILTFAALLLTLEGKAPLEAWLPLVRDIISNIITSITGIFAGIFI